MNRTAEIPEKKRGYADERGIKERLLREYGRALRGVTVEDAKRGHKFHRINAAAAVIHGKKETKKIAPECYSGSMTGDHFERWFEFKLLKDIKTGSVIIMDRASFHRKKQLEEICGKAKVNLLFLPAYSPDFNPIEKDWANMKRTLRDTAPLCDLLQTAVYDYWR
jgi:transposase